LQIEEKEGLSLDPDFWKDPKRAELILKELKLHKTWVEKYRTIETQVEDLEVLQEFQKMGEGTEEEVDKKYNDIVAVLDDVEFRTTLNAEEDELSCLLACQ